MIAVLKNGKKDMTMETDWLKHNVPFEKEVIMNYCNGMEENTASTLCNPCPYEYNCTKCKEETDKLARKSHKKKKKHNNK